MAATGLLIDPAWKSVVVVTGTLPPFSRTPYPRAHSISPLFMTAMLTPGML